MNAQLNESEIKALAALKDFCDIPRLRKFLMSRTFADMEAINKEQREDIYFLYEFLENICITNQT